MDLSAKDADLNSLAESNISLANELADKLKPFLHIDGVRKIERQISQEIRFLQKKLSTNELTINHILGSNLIHYNYLVTVLIRAKNIHHVDYPVKMGNKRKSSIRIDIVSNNGGTWIKVIARNSKGLDDGVNGEASYGTKSILDHAASYINAAEDNPFNFRPPKIVFDFAHCISNEITDELLQMGIDVRINGRSDEIIEESKVISKLNLDVTSLIAYVSAQTNGSNNWLYTDPCLTQQAASERVQSVKGFLDVTFEGMELIVCETASNSFQNIIHILAGPNERLRARHLLERIKVLPDLTNEQEQSAYGYSKLKISGQIKVRSLKIFLFGIYHKAITVSSNEGFVRSARMQGLKIPCIFHDARALTEKKEASAEQLS